MPDMNFLPATFSGKTSHEESTLFKQIFTLLFQGCVYGRLF